MPQTIQNWLLVLFGVLALWGAFDYIVESFKIFRRSLQRYRERNRD